jgi:putative cell wall-binding protein
MVALVVATLAGIAIAEQPLTVEIEASVSDGTWTNGSVDGTVTASWPSTITAGSYTLVKEYASELTTTTVDFFSGETTGSVQAPFTVAEEGWYTVTATASGVEEASATAGPYTFGIDTTGPVVEFDAGDYTEGSWSTAAVEVSVTATDTLSGFASMDYLLQPAASDEPTAGSAWETTTTASVVVPVDDEGEWTLWVWVWDVAGNSNSGTFDVDIDMTDPESTALFDPATPDGLDGAYTSPPTITIQATDALSGVHYVQWRLNDGSYATGCAASGCHAEGEPYSPIVSGITEGSHVLHYRAVDVAGNIEAENSVAFKVFPGPATPERLSARTRFSTAVAIALEGYPGWQNVKHVVIASGDDRAAADPLAASGLSWAYDAPMLLVSAGRTPDEVKAAISQIVKANGSVTLHVVGGPISVPNTRLAELVAAGGGSAKVKLDRILSSGTRYDLAAAISGRMKAVRGGAMPSAALVANGADPDKFFDALALSPIAAGKGAPILLVTSDSIPAATANALNSLRPGTIIVGGGPNTVSERVRAALRATRWSGRTRYDTAIAIANGAVSKGWLNRRAVGAAAVLPDALTGGSFVGLKGGVLVLTDGTTLTPATQSWLRTYRSQVRQCYVFGGPLSVSPGVVAAIGNALK